jgi:hypothetical protein
VVLLTDAFFAKFPRMRFFFGAKTNPRVYRYVDGALKEEVAAPKRRPAPASEPAPKRPVRSSPATARPFTAFPLASCRLMPIAVTLVLPWGPAAAARWQLTAGVDPTSCCPQRCGLGRGGRGNFALSVEARCEK